MLPIDHVKLTPSDLDYLIDTAKPSKVIDIEKDRVVLTLGAGQAINIFKNSPRYRVMFTEGEQSPERWLEILQSTVESMEEKYYPVRAIQYTLDDMCAVALICNGIKDPANESC